MELCSASAQEEKKNKKTNKQASHPKKKITNNTFFLFWAETFCGFYFGCYFFAAFHAEAIEEILISTKKRHKKPHESSLNEALFISKQHISKSLQFIKIFQSETNLCERIFDSISFCYFSIYYYLLFSPLTPPCLLSIRSSVATMIGNVANASQDSLRSTLTFAICDSVQAAFDDMKVD